MRDIINPYLHVEELICAVLDKVTKNLQYSLFFNGKKEICHTKEPYQDNQYNTG